MASIECSGVWRILVVSSMFACASIILTAPGATALKFLKNPSQFLSSNVGMNQDFNCTTDDPNATVTLRYNRNMGTWTDKLVTPNKLVLRGQVFTLLNLVPLDGGQYRCKATDKSGQTNQSTIAYLFVNSRKNEELIEIDKAKTSTEHNVQSTLHVYCIERSGGFLKVLFTKDGKNPLACNDSRVNVTVEKKNKKVSLYTLTVKNLTLNDTVSYGCTSELKYPTIFSSINITIKSLAAPNISDIPDQKVRQVEQGGIVMLWCQVTGNPKPSITWYFYKDGKGDSKKVNEENNDLGGNRDNCKTRTKGYYYLFPDDPSRLVICNPEFEQHQGKYKCLVKNKVGFMEKDAYVIVKMVPVIIEPEKGYKPSPLKIGDKLNMTCKAKGNPSPNITWIKNSTGEIVASSTTNYNQLLITSMKEEDFGVYSCIASNMLKSTEVSVNVVKAGSTLTNEGGGLSPGALVGIAVGVGVFVLIVLV